MQTLALAITIISFPIYLLCLSNQQRTAHQKKSLNIKTNLRNERAHYKLATKQFTTLERYIA